MLESNLSNRSKLDKPETIKLSSSSETVLREIQLQDNSPKGWLKQAEQKLQMLDTIASRLQLLKDVTKTLPLQEYESQILENWISQSDLWGMNRGLLERFMSDPESQVKKVFNSIVAIDNKKIEQINEMKSSMMRKECEETLTKLFIEVKEKQRRISDLVNGNNDENNHERKFQLSFKAEDKKNDPNLYKELKASARPSLDPMGAFQEDSKDVNFENSNGELLDCPLEDQDWREVRYRPDQVQTPARSLWMEQFETVAQKKQESMERAIWLVLSSSDTMDSTNKLSQDSIKVLLNHPDIAVCIESNNLEVYMRNFLEKTKNLSMEKLEERYPQVVNFEYMEGLESDHPNIARYIKKEHPDIVSYLNGKYMDQRKEQVRLLKEEIMGVWEQENYELLKNTMNEYQKKLATEKAIYRKFSEENNEDHMKDWKREINEVRMILAITNDLTMDETANLNDSMASTNELSRGESEAYESADVILDGCFAGIKNTSQPLCKDLCLKVVNLVNAISKKAEEIKAGRIGQSNNEFHVRKLQKLMKGIRTFLSFKKHEWVRDDYKKFLTSLHRNEAHRARFAVYEIFHPDATDAKGREWKKEIEREKNRETLGNSVLAYRFLVERGLFKNYHMKVIENVIKGLYFISSDIAEIKKENDEYIANNQKLFESYHKQICIIRNSYHNDKQASLKEPLAKAEIALARIIEPNNSQIKNWQDWILSKNRVNESVMNYKHFVESGSSQYGRAQVEKNLIKQLGIICDRATKIDERNSKNDLSLKNLEKDQNYIEYYNEQLGIVKNSYNVEKEYLASRGKEDKLASLEKALAKAEMAVAKAEEAIKSDNPRI